ncbi:MAG: hypothetical protein JST85_23185 [Acidobacteria bacterium]|nr:hypothetical protein [Acidobacteriota bacterium]
MCARDQCRQCRGQWLDIFRLWI